MKARTLRAALLRRLARSVHKQTAENWLREPTTVNHQLLERLEIPLWRSKVKADESTRVRPFEPKEYRSILAAVGKSGLQPRNQARVKACMQLQRWSGLSLVDAVCLSKDELQQDGKVFRVRTKRRKTGVHINNVIPSWLGKELLRVKNGNRTYFFISGEATPKGAVSTIDKMYRHIFQTASVEGTSHMFRHTFSVELLKAGCGHPQGQQGARSQLRDDHRTLLREVEQSAARHFGRGLSAGLEEEQVSPAQIERGTRTSTVSILRSST